MSDTSLRQLAEQEADRTGRPQHPFACAPAGVILAGFRGMCLECTDEGHERHAQFWESMGVPLKDAPRAPR